MKFKIQHQFIIQHLTFFLKGSNLPNQKQISFDSVCWRNKSVPERHTKPWYLLRLGSTLLNERGMCIGYLPGDGKHVYRT